MAAAKKQHGPDPSRDATIESLRPRFLAMLRKRQLALLKLRAALGKGEMGGDGYAALKKSAHAIYGSAWTFQYEDLARAAAALEEAVEQRCVHAGKQKILDALDVLLKACRAAQRADAHAVRPPSARTAPSAPSPADEACAGPCIVLIEDDPTMQALVAELLADEGAVRCADNAKDGRRLIEELAPVMAIVDVNLEGDASGLDLVESLKEDSAAADLPVIMLTASDKPDDVMRALVAGAVDYFPKPLDPAVFVEKIRSFLRARETLVLIADDDAPVCEILARKFHAIGVRTIEAVTGEEAFALVRDRRPSLVLLDRMMPGLDGVTVLQRMRSDPALRAIPVVFLTARRHDSDILEGLKLGAADYIVKPFNSDIVVTRCMRLIKGGQVAA